MKKAFLTLAGFTLLSAGSLCATQYQVNIHVADAQTDKVLSQPQVITTEGRPFNMKVGQTAGHQFELGPVEVGVTVSGTVKATASGAIHYAILLAVREMTAEAADGKSISFTVSEFLTNGEVAPGVPQVFNLGDKTITVTINPVKQPEAS